MRWDSPFGLATAGTLAIHLILFVLGDAVVVYNPRRPPPPAPRIEMVEVEVPPVITEPPPPPVAPPEPQLTQPAPPPVRVVARTQPQLRQPRATEPPAVQEPPLVTDPAPSGGDQVVTLDGAVPSATGVAVATGRRTSERVGRGGSGGGTGAGMGSGAGPVVVTPVSVATIKKRALPRGDFGYFDAGRDYPAEAKQLGIEGVIKVRLVVDERGKVASKVLLTRLGHGLDELALLRASKIEFEPALDTDDKPVSSVVVWTFNMTLPR